MYPWQFQLKNDRPITIRPVRPEDAPDLYAAARHPEVARNLMLHPALELAETRQFIDETPAGRHYLVAEIGGRAVGAVTLQQVQRPRMHHLGDLGLMVARDYWNVGVGHCLMQAALDLADNWLNLKRVELGVYANNEAAIHLYEKFGFQNEGLRPRWAFGDGGWLDSLLMGRLRNVNPAAGGGKPDIQSTPPGRAPSSSKPATDLVIRPPQKDDVEALYELMGHPLVARTTLQIPSQEIGLTERRLSQLGPGLYRLVAEANGRAVGMASLFQEQNPRRRHAAGLGMSVHPDYWGQRIGSALMDALIDLADNWLNITRVELDVNVDNPVGVRLYQKHDFQIEGIRRYHTFGDGRWADSYFMGRLKR